MSVTNQPHTTGGIYKFNVKIGTVDLIKYIKSIRLTNTITSIYPIVTMNLNIDTGNIILYEIFGQKPIEITIMLMGEDQLPKETINLQVIYLESTLSLVPKQQEGHTVEQDRQPITLTCIVLPCYQLLSTGVNFLYEEEAGLTPLDALIQILGNKNIVSPKLDTDLRNQNKDVINQLLIPPMSVIRCIDYLHEKFGLYHGPLFRYCNIDPITSLPVLIVKDLSQVINDNPSLTIWQLPVSDKGGVREKIMKKCVDNKNYFVDSPILTMNYANSNIITFRYSKIQIIHPDDTLFHVQPYNMDQIAKKFSTSENKQLNFLGDTLKSIEPKYCIDLKGFAYESPYNDASITSRMSDQIKNTFQVSTTVQHNLKISNLISVGCVVQLEPAVSEYSTYSGKYILRSSDINWNRSGDQWQCNCDIQFFRSSRSN